MRLSKSTRRFWIRALRNGKDCGSGHPFQFFVKDGKFVAINCSAIPKTFLKVSFSVTKRVPSPRRSKKIGKFQYAEGGTLFWTRSVIFPFDAVKLLRFLQEKMFTPVGANREIEANVRIIAATNRPLEEMNKKGEFREDLYYRLMSCPLTFRLSVNDARTSRSYREFVYPKIQSRPDKKIVAFSPEALSVLRNTNGPETFASLKTSSSTRLSWKNPT